MSRSTWGSWCATRSAIAGSRRRSRCTPSTITSGSSKLAAADPPLEDRALGAADGQIVAWAVIAIFDAIMIQRTVPLPLYPILRSLHHQYAAGHALAFGLASSAAIDVWRRVRPRPARRARHAGSACSA